jgi:hypothetical protein
VNVKVGEVLGVLSVGPLTVVSGAVTVHVRLAGVGSVPAMLIARTSKVCDPAASDPYEAGEEHPANPALSTRHSKAVPDGAEWKAKLAVVAASDPDGPLSMMVSGRAAIVHVELAGVASVPAEVTAFTWNVCDPAESAE